MNERTLSLRSACSPGMCSSTPSPSCPRKTRGKRGRARHDQESVQCNGHSHHNVQAQMNVVGQTLDASSASSSTTSLQSTNTQFTLRNCSVPISLCAGDINGQSESTIVRRSGRVRRNVHFDSIEKHDGSHDHNHDNLYRSPIWCDSDVSDGCIEDRSINVSYARDVISNRGACQESRIMSRPAFRERNSSTPSPVYDSAAGEQMPITEDVSLFERFSSTSSTVRTVERIGQSSEFNSQGKNGSLFSQKRYFMRHNIGLDSESDEETHYKTLSTNDRYFRSSFLVKRFWSFVYGSLMSTMNFDAFLLCRRSFSKKLKLFVLLLILPLLIFAGWWLLAGSSEERSEVPVLNKATASDSFFSRCVRLISTLCLQFYTYTWNWLVFIMLNIVESFSWSPPILATRLPSSTPIPATVSPSSILFKDNSSFSSLDAFIVYIQERTRNEIIAIIQDEIHKADVVRIKNEGKERSEMEERLLIQLKSLRVADDALVRQDMDREMRKFAKEFDEEKNHFESHYVTKEDISRETHTIMENIASLRKETNLRHGEITEQLSQQRVVHQTQTVELIREAFIEARMKELIRDALLLYSADKTGMADYAQESSGGTIVSTRCTEAVSTYRSSISILGVFVYPILNSPREVIKSGMQPGECWPFKGTTGYLVIKLSATIMPKAFSYEHIPSSISTTGKIDSAPREFSVYGLQSEYDPNSVLLGSYEYDQHGDPLQMFFVKDPDVGSFPIVELQVHSNHGHPEHTCLYRFRVHGIRQGL